jgi:hypothetical protein
MLLKIQHFIDAKVAWFRERNIFWVACAAYSFVVPLFNWFVTIGTIVITARMLEPFNMKPLLMPPIISFIYASFCVILLLSLFAMVFTLPVGFASLLFCSYKTFQTPSPPWAKRINILLLLASAWFTWIQFFRFFLPNCCP